MRGGSRHVAAQISGTAGSNQGEGHSSEHPDGLPGCRWVPLDQRRFLDGKSPKEMENKWAIMRKAWPGFFPFSWPGLPTEEALEPGIYSVCQKKLLYGARRPKQCVSAGSRSVFVSPNLLAESGSQGFQHFKYCNLAPRKKRSDVAYRSHGWMGIMLTQWPSHTIPDPWCSVPLCGRLYVRYVELCGPAIQGDALAKSYGGESTKSKDWILLCFFSCFYQSRIWK